jgi:hypothetical protein|tara:strand:- start:2063 stop:3079 length:1017 start_codon:yes stop_codon:yes gene_type:complete
MNYIDTKYVSLIGSRLRNFSKKKDHLWNFSCPYCGDSSKKKNKARGFVYRTKNDLFFKCHNCAMGTTVAKLIEYVDSNLYKEYVMERYKDGSNGTPYKGGYKTPKPKFDFTAPKFKPRLGKLKTFAELENNHPAVSILSERSLPRDSWNDIYFCPKFFEFTNTQVHNKFPVLDGDHPRMIIPFRKENGQIFAYQGRSFGDEKQKYITIILDTEYPKIFGMDRVDPNLNIYVTEGPFDSLFLDNAVAVAQSDLRVPQFKDKAVLVPDNEPRNPEICKQIERCIEEGYKVCLWPSTIKEKDINDMILSGKTSAEVLGIIHSNSHSGLKAQTVFNNWKRTY